MQYKGLKWYCFNDSDRNSELELNIALTWREIVSSIAIIRNIKLINLKHKIDFTEKVVCAVI